MVIFGVDTHRRNHTAVAVDEHGRELGSHTTGTTSPDHLRLLAWARRFGEDRTWAVEDCRQLSRRLEGDLLAAGERIVRVPPKLMAHCRTAARLRQVRPHRRAGGGPSGTAGTGPAHRAPGRCEQGRAPAR
ncbi:IS110 family transposase [Streptomyces humi]